MHDLYVDAVIGHKIRFCMLNIQLSINSAAQCSDKCACCNAYSLSMWLICETSWRLSSQPCSPVNAASIKSVLYIAELQYTELGLQSGRLTYHTLAELFEFVSSSMSCAAAAAAIEATMTKHQTWLQLCDLNTTTM